MPSDPMDWGKAAEEWARLKQQENTSANSTPRSSSRQGTPRQG